MRALDRKLLRDLRLMWSQALTIALVVASGIGGYLTTLSAVDSLALARERVYAEALFADVFASVKRAPAAALDTLRRLPGVAELQPRVEVLVRLQLPGTADPATGQLIGIDERQPQGLNRISLRGAAAHDTDLRSPGRPLPDGALPAWVSETFATAHGLKPGARVQALVNGRSRDLLVQGVALSPEFVFAGLWGMPDQRGFGVFWVDAQALAAALDMNGAFNRVSIRLAPGAREREVIDALQTELARWGGREAYGRAEQTSHAMLEAEIEEQQVLGSILPAIFLAVAAFLLNVVISRLVSTQREQIAALKALGYANAAIAAHYLKLVLSIVALGLLLGLLLGRWMGGLLVQLYAEFFRFPRFDHQLDPGLAFTALLLTVITAVLGTLQAILATVRLAPAEAMRPPAPGRYRRTWLDRAAGSRLPTGLRLILRNMQRRPWRSSLAVLGVAFAVAIVILGNFFRDAIAVVVDTQFNLVMRNDVSMWTLEPLSDAARGELLRLPGVKAVESSRFVPVRLVHGARSERNQIRGIEASPDLLRVIDLHGRAVQPSGEGLLLTDRLATKLGVRVGDLLRVEVLEGRARTLQLPVQATVSEMMGLNVYMSRTALNRALGEGDLSSGFSLLLEPGAEAGVLQAAREQPRLAGAFSKATMLRNMQELTARNIRIMSTVLTLFACVIAVGVVYNHARIALAERSWELASLRVLGFRQGEVAALLLGEMALTIAVALPLGMLLGRQLVAFLAVALKNDQFAFPVVIEPPTYAWAAIAVLLAAVASAWVVRRRIDALDMVAALKTRE